jgi:exopolyphosphatase / guanosine-5'-triphosphate,3'-diphosphate pyrophosphatase
VVNKLAGILRVADALIRGNRRRGSDIRFERRDDDLIVTLPGGYDLLLEEHALSAKGDLFEEIFGLKIRLEEA